MRATQIVHWPGSDTAACDQHAQKLYALASFMGFRVSATPISLLPVPEVECTNCENEKKAAEAK